MLWRLVEIPFGEQDHPPDSVSQTAALAIATIEHSVGGLVHLIKLVFEIQFPTKGSKEGVLSPILAGLLLVKGAAKIITKYNSISFYQVTGNSIEPHLITRDAIYSIKCQLREFDLIPCIVSISMCPYSSPFNNRDNQFNYI